MFSFLNKSSKPVERDLSFIGVDMHSHLLPGLDDGAVTIQETLHYFKLMKLWGYRKCIVTPHIFSGVYNNSPQNILPVYEKVKQELIKAEIDIEIEVAAEYMLDDSFMELLNQNQQLLCFGDRYVLIEMPFAAPSPYIESAIFNLMLKGYKPILAHPERYSYYYEDFAYYSRLIDMGCFFQVNMLSLSGYYGKNVKKIAITLINNKMVSFIGTDLHHLSHADAIKAFTVKKEFYKIAEKIQLKNRSL
jgi:protein-tyrosine phosphatase